MVRVALHYCYGQKTSSIYPENDVSDEYRKLVNVSDACEGFCKTHQPALGPIDDCHCIVVVRDPRRVFISLQEFYRKWNGFDVSMEDIIDGRHPWGDWSSWIVSWIINGPRNALWVHYETFDPKVIREWFNMTQIANTFPTAKELRAKDSMFGEGEKDGRGCLPKYQDRIFDRHGAVMTMLGYER